MRQSLGCITPELGWQCFYSTANMIADNQTWGMVLIFTIMKIAWEISGNGIRANEGWH